MSRNPSRIGTLVSWVLVLLCALAIFLMSATPADLSQMESGTIARWLAPLLHPGFETLDLLAQEDLLQQMDHVVRKLAHATEFAMLGFLLANALQRTRRPGQHARHRPRRLSQVMTATFLCALYAVSDEVHQLFVPGRASMATDVLIDTAGALMGILLLHAVLALARKGRPRPSG